MSEDKIEDAIIVEKGSPEKEKDVDIKQDGAKKPGISPRQQDQLNELMDLLTSGNGYLVTVTIAASDKLNHYLITNNFPEVDVLKSLKAVKELAIERLEKA